jgi:hypothetical protein
LKKSLKTTNSSNNLELITKGTFAEFVPLLQNNPIIKKPSLTA